MAFSRGTDSVVAGAYKRYIGVGTFKCHGVNLSKKELEELYGHEIQGEERQFVTEVDVNGVRTQRVNLNFVLSTMIGDKQEFFTARYSLLNAQRVGANTGKVQVMDEYGRTAWVTDEQFKAHEIPQYANGPASITANYRGIYSGEDLLTRNNGREIGFLVALLNIPNVTKFSDGKPVGLIEDPSLALCRLDNVANLFKGDFSEIREILSYKPDNQLKLLAGVRKDDQNRVWQDFFVDFPMRSSTRNYANLEAALDSAVANGKYTSSEFKVNNSIVDLTEYVETPTVIAPSSTAAAPANPWFQKPQA